MKKKSELEKAKASENVATLLFEAKNAILAAEQGLAKANETANKHYRVAVESIIKAKKNEASQVQIAEEIGKSEAWVSQLLRWARKGYLDSPFGPQSREARANKKESLGAPKDSLKSSAAAAEDTEAEAEGADNNTDDEEPSDAVIASEDRERLLKLLALLGSDQDGECLNAARKVEKLRKKLGVTWGDLIIPAEALQARAA